MLRVARTVRPTPCRRPAPHRRAAPPPTCCPADDRTNRQLVPHAFRCRPTVPGTRTRPGARPCSTRSPKEADCRELLQMAFPFELPSASGRHGRYSRPMDRGSPPAPHRPAAVQHNSLPDRIGQNSRQEAPDRLFCEETNPYQMEPESHFPNWISSSSFLYFPSLLPQLIHIVKRNQHARPGLVFKLVAQQVQIRRIDLLHQPAGALCIVGAIVSPFSGNIPLKRNVTLFHWQVRQPKEERNNPDRSAPVVQGFPSKWLFGSRIHAKPGPGPGACRGCGLSARDDPKAPDSPCRQDARTPPGPAIPARPPS